MKNYLHLIMTERNMEDSFSFTFMVFSPLYRRAVLTVSKNFLNNLCYKNTMGDVHSSNVIYGLLMLKEMNKPDKYARCPNKESRTFRVSITR